MARNGRGLPVDFDPELVGGRECDAWAAYYRHEWRHFLVAAVGMVHAGFGMSWPRTLRGAWLVLRANQVWAPVPDNDPDAARALMTRFYALVARARALDLDPVTAARLEVEWWRVHRELQRERPEDDDEELVRALAELYAYVYRVPVEDVVPAAAARTEAMRYSDAWVEAGCDPANRLLAREREALIRSYTGLRDAVRRGSNEGEGVV